MLVGSPIEQCFHRCKLYLVGCMCEGRHPILQTAPDLFQSTACFHLLAVVPSTVQRKT